MSEKIALPSGAKLDITLLPFDEAWGVVQTVSKILEGINVDLSGIDLAAINAADVLAFKSPLCSILGSREVIEAAKICFKRCTYDGIKIDSQTFEKRESRADYIPAVYYVIKENVSPFFANLISALKKK